MEVVIEVGTLELHLLKEVWNVFVVLVLTYFWIHSEILILKNNFDVLLKVHQKCIMMLLKKYLLWCRFLLMKTSWYLFVGSSTSSYLTLLHSTKSFQSNILQHRQYVQVVVVVVLVFCPWFRLHKVSSIFILIFYIWASQAHVKVTKITQEGWLNSVFTNL